jgi:hypothetical protein
MKLDSGDALPDLYRIVELFRNNRRLLNAQEGLATHRAFPATFQGQSIDKNESKKKSLCLCGGDHRCEDRPYLVESARTEDWQPDANIQEQIDTKLRNSEYLCALIDKLRKEQVSRSLPEQNTQQQDQQREEESLRAFSLGALSNLEDAELLVYLVDEEMDIYTGVLVAVCHLGPVGRVLSATSVQLNLYEYTPPPQHRHIISQRV